MGPFLVVLIFAMVISQFAFRSSPPHRRAILTAGSAWMAAATVFGLLAPSGIYSALVWLSIGAALVGVERFIHYSKHWTDEPETSDLSDTFR